METNYLIWLLLIPLILSLVAFAARWLKGLTRPVVEATHLLSVTLVLVMSLLAVRDVLVAGSIFSPGLWLHVDALSAIFLLIIGVVGFLAGLYSIGYTRHDLESGEFDNNKLSLYYGLFSLFLFTMLLVVTANNIIMMWVAVEATTLGSTFLVGIYGHHSSLEAAWKYVIICTVGVAFGLYGTILVYSDAVNVMQDAGDSSVVDRNLEKCTSPRPISNKDGLRFRSDRFWHQSRPVPDACLAARRPQRSAQPGERHAFGSLAKLRLAGHLPLRHHHQPGDRAH